MATRKAKTAPNALAGDMSDAEARGYLAPDEPPIVAPTPSQGRAAVRIRDAALVALETKRARLDALKEEAANLRKELDKDEEALMAALAQGASAPIGWALGIEETRAKSPSWKTEALALAIAAGQDPIAFEAEVRERTKEKVSRSLVVTKLG
jgi:hypothetical protein